MVADFARYWGLAAEHIAWANQMSPTSSVKEGAELVVPARILPTNPPNDGAVASPKSEATPPMEMVVSSVTPAQETPPEAGLREWSLYAGEVFSTCKIAVRGYFIPALQSLTQAPPETSAN